MFCMLNFHVKIACKKKKLTFHIMRTKRLILKLPLGLIYVYQVFVDFNKRQIFMEPPYDSAGIRIHFLIHFMLRPQRIFKCLQVWTWTIAYRRLKRAIYKGMDIRLAIVVTAVITAAYL